MGPKCQPIILSMFRINKNWLNIADDVIEHDSFQE